MEKETKRYIAFFDLDRTIISLNSSSLLVKQAYKNGMMSIGNLLNAIFQSYLYKYNIKGANLIILKMGTWLKGSSYESIDELSKEVVDKYLLDSIRSEIIEEIAFHKENNAGIVILSSAISSICEPIGRHLEVDDIICSTLESVEGILTGAPVGNFCFGDEKRLRLLGYCEDKHFTPSEAWYYADSVSDIPVFEVVGNRVCVSPDKKLARIARERKWRVI